METKPFGKRSGLNVAPISIGAMRLPPDNIDGVALIRHAIDSGMRYIDTSRGYGESEFVLGKALKDGYRERVLLSTKCSPWIKKITDRDDDSADSVRRRIEESMLRLDVDYLDFYQVWNINSQDAWQQATRKGGMVDGIRKAVDEGIVRHIGFTSHEKPEALLRYLPEADWCEALLLSFNLLSRDYLPVLEAAHELGIGTLVMNPVGGGKFAEDSPVFLKLVEQLGAASLPDLAIRYVLGHVCVDTILCGMSQPSDVDASVASAQRPPLSPSDIEQAHAFIDALSRERIQFCTNCGYCQPCPQGIEIPKIMNLIYEDRILGFKKAAKRAYGWTSKVKPDACTKCGECTAACTQGLDVIKEMDYAAHEYGEG